MRVLVFCVLAAATVLPSVCVAAPGLIGPVRVIDGDTIDVGTTRVRIFGIDAPETDQTCKTEQGQVWKCGAWVTKQVSTLFEGRQAQCQAITTDRYDRVVARCSVRGQDMAREIVRAGLAFAYRKYARDYVLDEKAAAVGDVGLHGNHVQNPSQFRQTRVGGRTPPDSNCQIKGNISGKGERIYHMPGQRDYERTSIRLENGERWFCSAAEADNAGWRLAKR